MGTRWFLVSVPSLQTPSMEWEGKPIDLGVSFNLFDLLFLSASMHGGGRKQRTSYTNSLPFTQRFFFVVSLFYCFFHGVFSFSAKCVRCSDAAKTDRSIFAVVSAFFLLLFCFSVLVYYHTPPLVLSLFCFDLCSGSKTV
jgi:hypothetical protein